MAHWSKRLKAPLRAQRLKRSYRSEIGLEQARQAKVSLVMVTWNRPQFLSWSLASLFATVRRDPSTWELIIWDNGSGSEKVLERAAERPNVRVLRSGANVGVNGYHHGFEQARLGDYLVELDDDVLWFPDGWLDRLVLGFQRVPRMGFLSADMIEDEYAGLAHPMQNERLHYHEVKLDYETTLAVGPASGHCAMTSRAIYDEVGGFPTSADRAFFSDDGHYNRMMRKFGYQRGILRNLKVYHACGPHCNYIYSDLYKEKISEFLQVEYQGESFELRTDFIETFRERYRPADLVAITPPGL